MLLEARRAAEPGVVRDVHEEPCAGAHEVACELRIDRFEADEDPEAVRPSEHRRHDAGRVLARRVEAPPEPGQTCDRGVLGEGNEAALVVEGQGIAAGGEQIGRVEELHPAVARRRVARSADDERRTVGAEDLGDGAAELRVRREQEAHRVLRPDDEVGTQRRGAPGGFDEDVERVLRARDVQTPRIRRVALDERDAHHRPAVVGHGVQAKRAVSGVERQERGAERQRTQPLRARCHDRLPGGGRGRREHERHEECSAELRGLDPQRVRVERVREEVPRRAEEAGAGELERGPAGRGAEHPHRDRGQHREPGERHAERRRGQRAHHLGHREREEHRAERALREVVVGRRGHPGDDRDRRCDRPGDPAKAEPRRRPPPARGRNERRHRNEAERPHRERRKAGAMQSSCKRRQRHGRWGAEWMRSV